MTNDEAVRQYVRDRANIYKVAFVEAQVELGPIAAEISQCFPAACHEIALMALRHFQAEDAQ